MSVIQKIVQWNIDRKLNQREFNSIKECSYVMSELFEILGIKKENHDEIAYEYITKLQEESNCQPSDDEIADGFGDIIVYCIGALVKLGYDPTKVLEIINEANEQKTKTINHLGKIVKPTNFQHPDISKAKIKS